VTPGWGQSTPHILQNSVKPLDYVTCHKIWAVDAPLGWGRMDPVYLWLTSKCQILRLYVQRILHGNGICFKKLGAVGANKTHKNCMRDLFRIISNHEGNFSYFIL